MAVMTESVEEVGTPTVLEEPNFSISEAALFLGRGTQWLRWRSEQVAGEYSEFVVPRGSNGYRRYTLGTMQKLADLLIKDKRISVEDYKGVVRRIQAFQ